MSSLSAGLGIWYPDVPVAVMLADEPLPARLYAAFTFES